MKELTTVADGDLTICSTDATVTRTPRAMALTALDEETLATLAKALGHPTRVRILRLLSERSACVTGDLVAQLPLAQSTVSEHLRILREAGLIQGEIEGPRTSYCIDRARINLLKSIVTSL
jgi:ArsR family transcriptional regulator